MTDGSKTAAAKWTSPDDCYWTALMTALTTRESAQESELLKAKQFQPCLAEMLKCTPIHG